MGQRKEKKTKKHFERLLLSSAKNMCRLGPFLLYLTEAASVLEMTGMAAAQNGFVSRSDLARKWHVDARWTGLQVHVAKCRRRTARVIIQPGF